ncbi:MBL fold metallo-hydrolase [Denitrificimonas sp. JX-1]|uniref:MBL fold metallo-hydrolase n=1 Tax=Denitrificimonas halotolerans TaxID=3098930 RepID=A0ABU5GMB6_9GAMM|nr:MBL fold metallo-hydrolase [Denitrificimonas sp. JX-1]MDY7218047.1 MBL fold metallo-hydrolase [Denitrificimonas sp. JX-1]
MKDHPIASEQKHHQLSFPWQTPPVNGQWQVVAEGVVWLRMPLPFGLDHINLYLLRHGDGWVIVDTGLGTEQTREVWERVFVEVMDGAPVKAVIATHFHYDHSGSLGWLVDRFKCPVYMTRGEYQALFISPSMEGGMGWQMNQFYQHTGMSDEDISGLMAVLGDSNYVQDAPDSYNRLVDNQVLRIGDYDWEVVIASGHSPEHACLYNRQANLFISGDQVLPRITSSVCVTVTEPDANPLKEWLDSLQALRAVSDEVLVLPAHERPFYGLHHRLGQLTEHHHGHLDAMLAQMDTGKTVDELMRIIFPKVRSSFDILMANGEVLAHLNFLLGEGRITRQLIGGVYRYQRLLGGDGASAETQVTHI